MKNITTKQFQILTDIDIVWNFMADVYDPHWANGAAAPFFEYAVTSSWMNKEYLHLDRLWIDGGKVAGFVFSENPVTNIFFNLRPGYEELADEMIEYAGKSFPDFGDGIELEIFSGQKALIKAAEGQGYKLVYEYNDMLFDFKKELNYDLPYGFHFVEPLECDSLKLAKCTWDGFNSEELGAFVNWNKPNPEMSWSPHKAYNDVLSSTIAPPPHSTYEYDVIIADDNEEYACFSGMWWVPQNKLAYMEPLCTVPKYRKMGLAAAALTQHYRRLKPLGAEYMTGGGSDFYKRIGYDSGILWLHYKKREI